MKKTLKPETHEWLMANGFRGIEGDTMPEMPDAFVWEVSNRYIELYELITGREFVRSDTSAMIMRIEENILQALKPK